MSVAQNLHMPAVLSEMVQITLPVARKTVSVLWQAETQLKVPAVARITKATRKTDIFERVAIE